ncbi:DHA2 family efflux MFS transporter permease subunit [Salinactinospora qingdaonensis]|uniref:MFS transporter n=1 Tax=Salinactinospora qingdaonensis TaxID=702744 RepID=A0ABP7G0X8_9ACTN
MTAERNPWSALTALVVGYFMVVLDMTIVAVANPVIMESLNTGVSQVVWATSAYLLTFAALLLPAGRLGDYLGPRSVYLWGLALFTLASLGCGLADSVTVLIAARAVQGVGAAMVTPQTMAMITRIFPPERRSAAMSLWGGVAGLANLVGPLLGGVLADQVGWEWIFFSNVPVGAAGLILAIRFVPVLTSHTSERRRRFDIPGVVLSFTGMFLLVFGIQEGGNRGWEAWLGWMIAAGVAVLVVFTVYQGRTTREPLLPLSIFRDRNFALSSVAVAAAAAAVAAIMVPLYFYLEQVRSLSGVGAGLLLAPMAILAMLFVPVVGMFGDRLHPRLIPVAGFTLFAATLMGFATLMTPDSPIPVFLVGAALAGIANACLWPSLAVTATLNLPLHQAGAGAGAYNTMRQVGSVLGSAAIAAVVASRMAVHDLGGERAAAEGVAAGEVPESAMAAFGAALSESMYLPVALLVLGAVTAAFIIRRATDAAPAPAPAPAPPKQQAED